MHPTDGLIHARRAPGILPDLLSQEAAEGLAKAVTEAGLHAEAVPQREVPDFEHSEVVHHARCLDEGFAISELHGMEEIVIPWSDIELVSVGRIPQESHRHFISIPD